MIAGRYTLGRELGRGGAGIVHLAHDELLGRSVAIKRIGLLPGTTGHDIARAEREARLAAGISHQHVVSIFDLVEDEDCYWLVMEYVEGRTLAELIAADGPLPAALAAGIIAQAADALAQAHAAGIVHRDVKPSNIMIHDDSHAKLGDFGIARSANDAALTSTGLVTGSPAYLAPEVASGSDATTASDVWSLGATLFHAIAGRPPYDVGANVLGGLYKIVHEDPPRLSNDHPLADQLAGMMQKDPGRRWPVARVRDELRRVARDEPGQGSRLPQEDRSDHGATVAMGTVSPASDTASDTASAPAPVPTPVPTPIAAQTAAGRPGFPLGRLVAVAALVLLVGLGGWLMWPDGEERDSSADPSGSTQSQEPQPSEKSSASKEPTEEPSATAPTTDPTTPEGAAAMRAFVQDYFSQVTSDPESTFEMLTPQFQSQSGGYESYSGFWSTIESATPSDIRVDAEALTTTYTIRYVAMSGRTSREQGRLRLQRSGDGYLIAGED